MAHRVVAGAFAGMLAMVGTAVYTQDEKAYKNILMPGVHYLLNGENAHRIGVKMGEFLLFPRTNYTPSEKLAVTVCGLDFSTPVGLAAGFDKDAECIEGMARTGFAAIEIGSVTPLPQPGNDKPRVFRLSEDEAVINRYGFNSSGHAQVKRNIEKYMERSEKTPIVLGINLGKNKTSESAEDDYTKGVLEFANLADYLVINISSPNTPGLRNLQARSDLDRLVVAVLKARDQCEKKPPIFVKIAPDLSEDDKIDIATVVRTRRVDGLIVSNTTISRPESLRSPNKVETGGLSGLPLKSLSTQAVYDMYRLTRGKVPIIGVGGISSGEDAYDKIKAGASLVQVYSAITYLGPTLAKKIVRELDEIVARDGLSNISEAVGLHHKMKSKSR